MNNPTQVKPRRPSERDAAGDPLRIAVLLVDMQNDYCHPDGVFHRRANMRLDDLEGLVRNTNRLIAAARSHGHDVIWMRMAWESQDQMGLLRGGFLAEEGLREGTWGAELVDGLDVHPDDAIFTKTRFSAFYDTALENHLKSQGIEGLVVGGVRTDYCVESTVRDAFFRDLEVWVVRECVGGYFDELHEHSLIEMNSIFADVVSLDDALSLLERLAPVASK